MNCSNHPKLSAIDRCTGCAEGYCDHCLAEVEGQKYCKDCKYMAVTGPPPKVAGNQTMHKQAMNAFWIAFAGIFIAGIILGPIAISKGIKAKNDIDYNPELSGRGMATAAIIIGAIACFANIIACFSRLSNF